MAGRQTKLENVLLFNDFDVGKRSVYIVEGLSSFGVYHVNKAVNPVTKENFILFLAPGTLDLSGFVLWNSWKDCSRAKYEIDAKDENNVVFKINFDVSLRNEQQTKHVAKFLCDDESLSNCVDDNTGIFIIRYNCLHT